MQITPMHVARQSRHVGAERHVPKEYAMFRPSRVEFQQNEGDTVVILDDRYKVKLDRRHNTVGQLSLGIDESILKKPFSDGEYFIVDGRVVDYRTGPDLKFRHDDESIKQLVDHLGMTKLGNQVVARSVTSKLELGVLDTIGGDFNMDIGFEWSPFELDIASYVHMLRLVCENGMVARAPIMNHTIPMMNQWQENIEISSDVIRHQIEKNIAPRLQVMPVERVSMHDVLTMRSIVNDLKGSKQLQFAQVRHLDNMYDILDSLVDEEVLSIKKNMLQFVPAPVSAYDAMNIMTECATHYMGNDVVSMRPQAFANHLLFNEDRGRKLQHELKNLVTDTHTFMDADRAFFGATSH